MVRKHLNLKMRLHQLTNIDQLHLTHAPSSVWKTAQSSLNFEEFGSNKL